MNATTTQTANTTTTLRTPAEIRAILDTREEGVTDAQAIENRKAMAAGTPVPYPLPPEPSAEERQRLRVFEKAAREAAEWAVERDVHHGNDHTRYAEFTRNGVKVEMVGNYWPAEVGDEWSTRSAPNKKRVITQRDIDRGYAVSERYYANSEGHDLDCPVFVREHTVIRGGDGYSCSITKVPGAPVAKVTQAE